MDISAEIAAIQAASQGSELRQPLVGVLNKLNSGSLPAVTAADAGKILKVGANGWEVGEKSGYMPVPTATKQITENGTHDVTDYASAVVNVSGGGSSILIPKTITQNGTYDPTDDNADGYSEVTVNVPSGQSINFVGEYKVGYNSNARMIIYKQRIVSNTGHMSYRNIMLPSTTIENTNDFEIGCAFKLKDTNSIFTLFGTVGTTAINYYPSLEVDTSLNIGCGYTIESDTAINSWTEFFQITTISLNTWYFARVRYISSTNTLIAEVTSDFTNYTSITKLLSEKIKILSDKAFCYGCISSAQNRSKTALIDLYNSYIKVGNNITFGAFTEQFPDFA